MVGCTYSHTHLKSTQWDQSSTPTYTISMHTEHGHIFLVYIYNSSGIEFGVYAVKYSVIHFFFAFLGLHLRHMKAPRLGVQSELQLPAYSTATAT